MFLHRRMVLAFHAFLPTFIADLQRIEGMPLTAETRVLPKGSTSATNSVSSPYARCLLHNQGNFDLSTYSQFPFFYVYFTEFTRTINVIFYLYAVAIFPILNCKKECMPHRSGVFRGIDSTNFRYTPQYRGLYNTQYTC